MLHQPAAVFSVQKSSEQRQVSAGTRGYSAIQAAFVAGGPGGGRCLAGFGDSTWGFIGSYKWGYE